MALLSIQELQHFIRAVQEETVLELTVPELTEREHVESFLWYFVGRWAAS